MFKSLYQESSKLFLLKDSIIKNTQKGNLYTFRTTKGIHRKCFTKKPVLKHFAKFTRKHSNTLFPQLY